MAKVPTPNQKYVLLEPMGSGIWARWEHDTFTLQQVQLMLDACQIDSTWKLDKLGAHSAKPLRGYPELNLDYDAAIVVHHEDFKTTLSAKRTLLQQDDLELKFPTHLESRLLDLLSR